MHFTMLWTEDGKRVSQLPEEIHEGKPHHAGKKKPLFLNYTDTEEKNYYNVT